MSNPFNIDDVILTIIGEYTNVKFITKKYKRRGNNKKLNIIKIQYKCNRCNKFQNFNRVNILPYTSDDIRDECNSSKCNDMNLTYFNNLKINELVNKYGYYYKYNVEFNKSLELIKQRGKDIKCMEFIREKHRIKNFIRNEIDVEFQEDFLSLFRYVYNKYRRR